eukprot:535041_1
MAKEEMMVGYHDGSAFLIGGNIEGKEDVMEYRFGSNDFVIHLGLGDNLDAVSQSFTQIDSTIFMEADSTPYIASFDMKTLSYDPQSITKADASIEFNCYANVGRYLFVLGGTNWIDTTKYYYDTFFIYDFVLLDWISNGPSMIDPLVGFACNVDSTLHYLYTFGGSRDNTGDKLDTVRAIDVSDMSTINSQNWFNLNPGLSVARSGSTSVVYNQFIYVIGGRGSDGTYYGRVDVVDTQTNTVTLDSNMVYAASKVAAVIAPDYYTLYVFGGSDGTRQDIMQYTNFPTVDPTHVPSSAPVISVWYPYGIGFDFIIEFNEYRWNASNQSEYDPYLYCGTYFSNTDQTDSTLQDVDAIIKSILQLLVSNNDDRVIDAPQTNVSANPKDNNPICQSRSNRITLETIFKVESVSVYNETQKRNIYGETSLFYNQTIDALEQYFKTPIIIHYSNDIVHGEDDEDDVIRMIIKDSFIVYIGAVIVTFVVILLAFIHKKFASNQQLRLNSNILLYKFHAIDDIKFTKIIAFTLQSLDLWSDFDFVYKLFVLQSMNLLNLIIISSSLFFAVVPYVINMWLVFYVQKKRRFNRFVHEWLETNHTMKIFMLFMCLCGSIFHSFGLSNSYIFGYNLFLAPLNVADYQILTQLRFKYLIVFESLPQLIIQGVWLWTESTNDKTINESLFFTAYISIALSLFSILASVLEYLFKCAFGRIVYNTFEIKMKVKQKNKKEKDDNHVSKAVLSNLYFHLSLERAVPMLGIENSNVYHTQYNNAKGEVIIYGIYRVDSTDCTKPSSKNKANFTKAVMNIFDLKENQLSFVKLNIGKSQSNKQNETKKNIELQITSDTKQKDKTKDRNNKSQQKEKQKRKEKEKPKKKKKKKKRKQ